MKRARNAVLYALAALTAMTVSVTSIKLTSVAAVGVPPFVIGMGIIAHGLLHVVTGRRP